MRIIVSVFIFFLFFNQLSFAQFSLSANAGANYNLWDTKLTDLNIKGKFGYFFGIEPAYRFNKKITVYADMQYSNQGLALDYNYTVNDRPVINEYSVSYLRINPALQYSIADKLAIFAGPDCGFKLNEHQIFSGTKMPGSIFDIFKKVDMGIAAGISYSVKRAVVAVQYTQGLNDVLNYEMTDTQGNRLHFNKMARRIQLGLGFKII